MEDIQQVFVNSDEPDVAYSELDFDQQLNYTQNLKHRALHKLTTQPGGIATDKESIEVLLKLTDSMDKTTIAKKRANTEAKVSDGALSILQAIATSVAQGGNKNPFVIEPSGDDIVVEPKEIGELPSYENKHAAGEGEQGVITETSEAFTARMEKINDEAMAQRERDLGIGFDIPNTNQ